MTRSRLAASELFRPLCAGMSSFRKDSVMKIEAKLAQMGLKLPEVGAPAGLYVPAKRIGNLIYT